MWNGHAENVHSNIRKNTGGREQPIRENQVFNSSRDFFVNNRTLENIIQK